MVERGSCLLVSVSVDVSCTYSLAGVALLFWAKIYDTTWPDVDKGNQKHTTNVERNEIKLSFCKLSTLFCILFLYKTAFIVKHCRALLDSHAIAYQIHVSLPKFPSSYLPHPL